MIYEDQGDFEKSHQLALIAAHLSPQDADEWLRLAEVYCRCIIGSNARILSESLSLFRSV
jgi:hypothetical protein